MQNLFLARCAVSLLLIASVACARNEESNDAGAAPQDTTASAVSDSTAPNQTESGVVDSTGQSTLGPDVEQTRPDEGQPVTSKGDTLSTGSDSSAAPQ